MIVVVYVRPKQEYNIPIWSPYLIKNINQLEYVQIRYTRRTCNRCNISNTSYLQRLVKLNLKYLEYRRLEFDLIILSKVVNGETTVNYDIFMYLTKKQYILRGNSKK